MDVDASVGRSHQINNKYTSGYNQKWLIKTVEAKYETDYHAKLYAEMEMETANCSFSWSKV